MSITTRSRDDNMEIEITEGYFYDPESVKKGYRLLYHYLAEDILEQEQKAVNFSSRPFCSC